MSQCFIRNVVEVSRTMASNDSKPPLTKEKVMSYEEKSVGSTPFFKCEACPYMALAEDDIKFHLFTEHPELAKTNGLADNIQIPCPGCSSAFDAEETLRTHLRNHHKMGIKDVKKMVKSLVQIALKNAKLKKESKPVDTPLPSPIRPEMADVKLIEIVPDVVNANTDLPKGVSFISMDELHKMSTPNFEKVDPKEIIQEASINIVYTNDVPKQYVNVSNAATAIPVSSVPPDLISSIQPRVTTMKDNAKLCPPQKDIVSQIPKPDQINCESKKIDDIVQTGTSCTECHVCFKDLDKLAYHGKCHQSGKLVCPECGATCKAVDTMHSHLWKKHSVDMELPTCEVCGYKTHSRYRLYNIHMKCHGKIKAYICPICSKPFKTANQLSKHKLIHKLPSTPVQCPTCQKDFNNDRQLKVHISNVHDKVKPFKCCHCEYTCATKCGLKLHLRSHTGDKPYSCNQCSYRSADHNSMRRHKRFHSKESPYKCKYCPYSAIQSNIFATHMISKHPNVTSSDVHLCPYCPFKSVNKDKYVVHLTTHMDQEGIQLLIEMAKSKPSKPSWTIPSKADGGPNETTPLNEAAKDSTPKTVNIIPIEVYDCDSLSESLPQDYPKNYCTNSTNDTQASDFNSLNAEPMMVTDLSKEDNNSDCLISESSNDTLIERHQYPPQLPLQIPYDSTQSNLHDFLNTTVSMEQSLMQSNNVNSLAQIPSNMNNNIMSNFPIRLPPVPQISVRNNITLKPIDKIPLPMTKVTGPILLPVPSLSNSPVNIPEEGAPRKKPKISVKSNLILKGPDQVNMFHSQQKMAFRRLEDNERFGLPVTFNNLTQFMQLQPEPALSESPNNIMPYPQEPMLGDSATTPVSNDMNENPQIFTFTQQMSVNSMSMLPPQQKIQTNDPSYIKLEATIKQNTQSPSLERMCNANLLNNPAISREYKASPPLEDIHKNINEIKNEVKSDGFYSMPMNSASTNPSIIDQYLMDNIIGEQYSGHTLDLSTVALPEISNQQNDVIEIDDNSDDNKLLPRFDMNFPLESLYLMHNDFHFLENDVPANEAANDINRIATDVPTSQKDNNIEANCELSSIDFPNFIQGKKDPMMNTSVRPTTNKINVKNIELMKN